MTAAEITLALAMGWGLAGCHSVGVRTEGGPGPGIAVDGLKLSEGTSLTRGEAIAMLGLQRECQHSTLACAQRLLEAQGTVRPATRTLAAAETMYQAGRRSRGAAQQTAWHECARHAHRLLFAADLPGRGGALEARSQLGLRIYNACVAGLVDVSERSAGSDAIAVRWDLDVTRFPVHDVDHIERADRLVIDGLRTRQYDDGLGVAAVAFGRTRVARGAFPPQPFALAINVRFAVEADGSEVLVITDASRSQEVETAWGRIRLARDRSAAYAWAARAFDAELSAWNSFRGVELAPDSQIRVLAPIDPAKVPVILIHGVGSSPMTWANMVNELQGDPDIADNYQFWLARYSTGLPILINRQRLYASFQNLRSQEPTVAPGTPTVLVGHSMGGVLARLLVTDPGETLWKAAFTTSPERLRAAPDDVAAARALLLFQPLDEVDEVVFIAAPHGGSALADGFIARTMRRLIRMPPQTLGYLSRVVLGSPDDVNPALRESYARGGPDSLGTLSPNQPVMQAARQLPVRSGVTVHSIIGIRHASRPDAGDGVVSLESARWPAGSEVRVAGGHDLHVEPATILVLKQILLDRLTRQSAAEPP